MQDAIGTCCGRRGGLAATGGNDLHACGIGVPITIAVGGDCSGLSVGADQRDGLTFQRAVAALRRDGFLTRTRGGKHNDVGRSLIERTITIHIRLNGLRQAIG